ncbi:MAG: hypothetical protein KGI27_10655 [Thaumarchaeota archaeon]|nr:hypothetical protein [Nitrososphaerota archaeon]
MRIAIPIVGIGITVFAFGVLFFLQGNSVVGPTSSFMYSNTKWITYGKTIAAVGIGVIVLGIVTSLRRPKS